MAIFMELTSPTFNRTLLYPLAGKLNLTGRNQLASCNHVNRNLNLLLINALLLGRAAGGV
jgi:hypothetical protein